MKIIGSVLLVLLFLYILLVIFMLIFQSKFIYYPYREVSMTPGDIRLQYQDVYFKTEDGVKLNGWFIPSDNSDIVILFFHGNGGNISHRLESIQLFHKMGF